MNAYVKAEFRAIQSSLGAKISSQFFNYDRNGNRLGLSQYDLVPAYTFSTDQYGSPLPQVPSGATLIRSTANTFARNAGASIDADPQTRCSNAADDAQGYWHELETAPGAAAKLDSPASMQISDLNGIRARTEYTYDNALTTGNPTKETSWDSTMGAYSNPLSPSNSISTSHTYDAGGNVTSTTDPNGVATSYAYGNPFSCPSADGTRFANPFSMTKAGLTTQFRWDCGVALPTYTVDPNGVTTKRTYDNLGRTTLLQEAWTLGTERQTLISYNETAVDPKVPLIVTTSKDLTTTGDLLYITTQKFDQRGQAAMQQVGDATTQHLGPVVYGGASYEATANPQFATADATAGWARTTRDTMGRPNRVDYFAGGTPPFPWGNNPSLTASATTNYNGYSTTIIDENFNVRQQIVDGAGRLASVTEDPTSSHQTTLPILNYLTSYQYDFHDNLTAACQNGQFVNGVCQSSQTARSFTYSSLGRLLTVTNPESGQTNYTYDQNGNLLTKRDARVTVTTFAFDNLNRLRSKTYSDGTATATYCYGDDATNQTVTRGAGSNALSVAWSCQGAPSGATNYLLQRLTKVAGDQSQTQYTQYDPLGNIKVSQQTTSNPNSATYPFSSYMYNTHGLLTSMALPSGRTLSWTYDTSVRPIGVSGVFTGTGTTTYASVPVGGFWPNAAIKTLKLAGNNLTQSSVYDSRLRPMSLSVTSSTASDTLGYSWNANGNLQQETINNSQNPLTLTQTFAYDSINRLISVNESGGSNEWNQAYGYDPWGSRSLLVPTSNFVPYSGVTPQASPPVLGQTVMGPFTNNRVNGAGYDAAGNETGRNKSIWVHGPHELAKKVLHKKMSVRDENRHLDVKREVNFRMSKLIERYRVEYGSKKKSADREKSILDGIGKELGHLFVREVDGSAVHGWYRGLTEKRELSAGTAVRHFNVMHHMMKKAATIWSKETGIDRNPADQVEVFRPDDQRERYLSIEEMKSLKTALDAKVYRVGTRDINRTFYRLRAIALIALTTGMRMAEIFGLTWSDLRYGEGLIAVCAKLKGGRIRYVPLTPELAGELRKYPAVLGEEHLFPPKTDAKGERQRVEKSFATILN